jgi:hypothetical protein
MDTNYGDYEFRYDLPSADTLNNTEKKIEFDKKQKVIKLALMMHDNVQVEYKETMLKAKELGFETEIEEDDYKYYIHFNKVIPDSEAYRILQKVNNIKRYVIEKIDAAINDWKLLDYPKINRLNTIVIMKYELDNINPEFKAIQADYYFEWLKKIMKDLGYNCTIAEMRNNKGQCSIDINIYWE